MTQPQINPTFTLTINKWKRDILLVLWLHSIIFQMIRNQSN
jgi:hypothetical protein